LIRKHVEPVGAIETRMWRWRRFARPRWARTNRQSALGTHTVPCQVYRAPGRRHRVLARAGGL